jgi:hypothetical protein
MMKNTNKYGFISGGYIADILDRAALEAVNQKFHNADKLIFTRTAELDYRKQLCNLRSVKTIVDFVEYDTAHRQYVAGVKLRQIDTDIAYGTFYFKQAFKNFCEIKN